MFNAASEFVQLVGGDSLFLFFLFQVFPKVFCFLIKFFQAFFQCSKLYFLAFLFFHELHLHLVLLVRDQVDVRHLFLLLIGRLLSLATLHQSFQFLLVLEVLLFRALNALNLFLPRFLVLFAGFLQFLHFLLPHSQLLHQVADLVVILHVVRQLVQRLALVCILLLQHLYRLFQLHFLGNLKRHFDIPATRPL